MARCYETLTCIGSVNAYGHSPLRNVENCLELELTFDGEVLDGKMILPIVGQALVERAVLLGRDILWIASPERLRLIELLIFSLNLFDLLRLLLLRLVVVDLLDLGFSLLLSLLILNFLKNRTHVRSRSNSHQNQNQRTHLLNLLSNNELDGIVNELGEFLYDLLDFLLFQVLELIFLEV